MFFYFIASFMINIHTNMELFAKSLRILSSAQFQKMQRNVKPFLGERQENLKSHPKSAFSFLVERACIFIKLRLLTNE